MDVRKVQLTGKSTFTVSLPKVWAQKVSLKAGDTIVVNELDDGSIKLIPPAARTKPTMAKCSTIKISEEMKSETLSRRIISDYLAGYDIIKISARGSSLIEEAHRQAVRETANKLIGIEIIEQRAGEVTLQCLLDYSKLSIVDVIKKMRTTASSMQRDSIVALLTGNVNLAKDIVLRDEEVDRLYLLAVKQLKDAIRCADVAKAMNVSPRACLGYRVIVKTIERIADHSERIARNAIDLGGVKWPASITQAISEMSRGTNKVYEKSFEALLTMDENKAEEAIESIESVKKIEIHLIERLTKQDLPFHLVCRLNIIIDSIRRAADYGTDIAEIVLNLAAGEPT